MKGKSTVTVLLTALFGCLLLTGCQPKSYTVTVSGDAIKDGDTLYLTNNLRQLTPIDTAITANGKAVFHAPTDSTFFASVYKASNPNIGITLFVGPEKNIIFLSKNAGGSKVAGSEINERWREMSDSIYRITIRMNALADLLNKTSLPYQEQKRYVERMKVCNNELKAVITNYARKNINNELGFFILTFYDGHIISPDIRNELIRQLPQAMRDRPAIRQLSKQEQDIR